MDDKKKYINVRTKKTDPKLSFRVSKLLREKLELCAVRAGRSINVEIIIRLIQSLRQHDYISEIPKKNKKENNIEKTTKKN